MIHLDACFLIRTLVPGTPEDRKVRDWLGEGEVLGMNAVSWAEFLCGPLDAAQAQLAGRIVSERAPLLEDDARLGAELFAVTGRRRGSLPDCLIAATAIRLKVPLATANRKDFLRFEPHGLVLAAASEPPGTRNP